MAFNDTALFQEFLVDLWDAVHDFDTDVYKMALITTLPVVGQGSPTLGDFTEVSGTGYTAGGETVTLSKAEAAGTISLTMSSTPSWAQNAAGPTNIVAAILYNSSKADQAVLFIDLTADSGSTPRSLVEGAISVAPPSGNVIYTSAIQ